MVRRAQLLAVRAEYVDKVAFAEGRWEHMSREEMLLLLQITRDASRETVQIHKQLRSGKFDCAHLLHRRIADAAQLQGQGSPCFCGLGALMLHVVV